MKKVISTCIYCGCGCKLTYHIENNKIIKISGYSKDDISEGKPCIKGLTINEVFDKNRIKTPLIRKKGKLIEAEWDEVIDLITKEISSLKNPDEEIIVNGSGKITNEENFLLYKIAKELFNTKNIDSCCGRLCHISTVKGLNDCLGASNLTRMSNLNDIDTLLIIGSNPAVTYPVFWNKILKRKQSKKLKIISVQPLQNLTSEFGDIFLEILPGTETALLNGIINYLTQKGSTFQQSKRFKNFNKLKKISQKYPLGHIAKICGAKEKDIVAVCEAVSNSKKLGIFHGMNFTQHINSLENVHTLLNLLLLKNAKILTLRGEINVQGVGDILSADKNLKGNLMKSFLLEPNKTKIAFITEFNPAQSLPNLNETHKALEKIFIIYLGSYFNLTCDFADVVLPLPALFESNGTITNGEQRIRLVSPVIKTEHPDLLEISKMLAKKFKKEKSFQYKNSKDIFQEIIKIVSVYKNLNPDLIYKGQDAFPIKQIKHRIFFPEEFKGKDDSTTKKYPFFLTTFRDKEQFLTSEITSQSKTLTKLDKDKIHIYINPKDAARLKIKNEDKIKVSSEIGSIIGITFLSEKTSKGIIATRFHYKNMLVNKLFPTKYDDITFTPNYKCVAVKVEKI